jgi:hypothetical protein
MYRIEKRVSPCLVLPGGGVFRFESLSVAMASPAFFMREDLSSDSTCCTTGGSYVLDGEVHWSPSPSGLFSRVKSERAL